MATGKTMSEAPLTDRRRVSPATCRWYRFACVVSRQPAITRRQLGLCEYKLDQTDFQTIQLHDITTPPTAPKV